MKTKQKIDSFFNNLWSRSTPKMEQ